MTVPARRSRTMKLTASTDGPRGSSRSYGSRGRSAETIQRETQRLLRNQRYAEERAARVREADITRDPDGSWHRRCRELADETGIDVAHVLDEWEERAAVREYLGEARRDEANRLAFADVADRLRPQRRLL